MLGICVCGWYLKEYDEFYMMLHKLHHKENIPVYIVSNKNDPFLNDMDLPYSLRDNTGLEFGAYDYYLKNIWDEKSDVLFMHDDIVIHPFIRKFEILPPERIFDHFKNMDIDHAYIFNSRAGDVENDGKHGRMFYMSAKILRHIKEDGGFYYDDGNNGGTMTKHYNVGIEMFDKKLSLVQNQFDVKNKFYIRALELIKRGGKNEYKKMRIAD